MQAAKDSFYVSLRDRLATLNPLRELTVNGISRPAILVAENELGCGQECADAFYLHWGAASCVVVHSSSLMKLDCMISYGTLANGTDRGRTMGSLDAELISICEPRVANKMNHAQSPPVPLGTNVFWSLPALSEMSDEEGRYGKTAKVTVYFFQEEQA